ncbi:hypothetical protein [Ruicaihuangia caeni]|uniref:Integral membrane protein n=1 Tax=Ruicaihuangia caeni TaxID=3042517 RepID=A0AAW6T6S2_9MICO|nr:hypothetical protein [Klugiella sp. YN-L-19]MDI2097518.1 hypothetical protein [Klugiella sp. YN-L-19]
MIDWFTWLLAGVSLVGGLACLVLGAMGRKPNDFTLGAVVLVEALLLAQVVMAIVAPFLGNRPTGHPVEFWAYLISAVLIPPLAVFWGLVERNRWSTIVLGVASLAITIMVLRMHTIWFVQFA